MSTKPLCQICQIKQINCLENYKIAIYFSFDPTYLTFLHIYALRMIHSPSPLKPWHKQSPSSKVRSISIRYMPLTKGYLFLLFMVYATGMYHFPEPKTLPFRHGLIHLPKKQHKFLTSIAGFFISSVSKTVSLNRSFLHHKNIVFFKEIAYNIKKSCRKA